jgi:hypothetical protein
MPFALLDGFMQFITDPASSWIIIPVLALMIPIVAIMMEPVKQRLRAAERREARQAYERIAMEKLEVLKAGITMGYSQQELKELDQRLERLIGEDKLKKVLDPAKSGKLDKQLELDAQLDPRTALDSSAAKSKA